MMTAASLAGIAGAPQFAFGQSAGGKTLIKVFMRGGADGLHLFPPVNDPFYREHRPNLAIEAPSGDINSAIDIGDSYRAMNPNLEPLMEIWDAGRMMVAPATALESGNRSHFDNQRWIGNGARNNLIDGYLNRYMQRIDGVNDPLRGAILGKNGMSAELAGNIAVPVIRDRENFELENRYFCQGSGCADNQLTELMREIASHPVVDDSMEGAVRDNQIIMLESIAQVQEAGDNYTTNAGGLEYSNSNLGRGLKLAAQLLKAGVPLEVAAVDWNIGWDTHANQIPGSANRFTDQNFNFHRQIRQGATDFVTFYRDILPIIDDVVVVACTEFGRTVLENGSFGTDHGHSSSWFAFGGPTARGVGPDISTLDRNQLRDQRFTPTATEYQDVIGEIMVRHMNMSESLVSAIFPEHNTFTNHNLFSRTS